MNRHAFTLLELMVSIAIIAVLLSLAVPAFLGVRSGARRAACAANLRGFGAAIQLHRDDHDGALPYADRIYNVKHGWTDPINALAPYFDGVSPPRVDDNGVIHCEAPFRCPDDPKYADETGLSYAYFPSQFMPSLTAYPFITEAFAAKLTTVSMYDRAPWTLWVFADRDGFHPKAGPDDVSRKNALRFDGAVGPAAQSDIE